MNWIQALKAWNKKKGGKYTIPKKGTDDYMEVKKMMEGGGKMTTMPVKDDMKMKGMKKRKSY
tara:strand:+ start:217 stop:402 length:186 start_codon:yes stop_codon:yes gene_type:complete